MDPARGQERLGGRLTLPRIPFPGGVIARALILVPLVMALWWFGFRPPSLSLLRTTAYLPLAFCVAPAGMDPIADGPVASQWTFNVALEKAGKQLDTGRPLNIHTVSFEGEIDQLTLFAAGWPCYLALALSAGGNWRRQIWKILRGEGLQTGINVVALALWATSSAYINTPLDSDNLGGLYHYVHYLCEITPLVSPFVVALIVHAEWRSCFDPAARGALPGGSPS